MTEFNFSNIFSIGGFDSSNQLYINAFQDDKDIIYSYIWDDVSKFETWKNNNNYKADSIQIEKNIFLANIIKSDIKYIFLNPVLCQDSFKSVFDYGSCIKLSSAHSSIPLIISVFNSHEAIFLVKLIISSNKKQSLKSFVEKIIKVSNILNIKGIKILDSIEGIFKEDIQKCDLTIGGLRFIDHVILNAEIKFYGRFLEIRIGGKYNKNLRYVYFKPGFNVDNFLYKWNKRDESLYIIPSFLFVFKNGKPEEVKSELISLYKVNSKIYNQIKRTVKNISKETLDIAILYSDIIDQYNLILARDNDVLQMAANFVKLHGLSIYYDLGKHQYLDIIFYERFNPYGFKALITEKLIFQKTSLSLDEIKEELKNSHENAFYFLEKFMIFSNYIADKYHFKNDLTVYSAYVLLYEEFKKFASNQFKIEFGKQLAELSDLNANSVIKMLVYEEFSSTNNNTIYNCICYLMQNNFIKNTGNMYECLDEFFSFYEEIKKTKSENLLINSLKNEDIKNNKVNIAEVDLMDGYEFELFISELFKKMGFETEITKASGDQGIDVIAINNNLKIGIQSKCYSGTVGNSAIQEAVAGKNHYRLDKAMVITNSYFSESAIKLAESNSVILWNREMLKNKINEVY